MEELSCFVCLNQYTSSSKASLPRILPCGHTMCSSCITSLKRKACPLCNFTINFNQISEFPINRNILNLSEGNCNECQNKSIEQNICAMCSHCKKWICQKCRQHHLDSRRKNAADSYEEIKLKLELQIRKLKMYMDYETTVFEQSKIMYKENNEKFVDDSFREKIEALIKERESKKEFLRDKIEMLEIQHKKMILKYNDIKMTDNFIQFEEFDKFLNEINSKLAEIDEIEKECENESPVYVMQNVLNTSNLSINTLLSSSQNDISEWVNAVKEDLKNFKPSSVSAVVLGMVKAGKSAFINTFRDLKPGEREASKVKCGECTSTSMNYKTIKKNLNMILWDCPGFGTNDKPQKEYIELLKKINSDLYIYLYKDAIKEYDCAIINDLKSTINKPVFIVRTHADLDYTNTFESLVGEEFYVAQQEVRKAYEKQVTEECRKIQESELANCSLQRENFSFYYISCKLSWKNKFDYQKLHDDIIDKLPEIQKLNVFQLSKNAIYNKLDEIKGNLTQQIHSNADDAAKLSFIPLTMCNEVQKKVFQVTEYYIGRFNVNRNKLESAGVYEKLREINSNLDMNILDVNSQNINMFTGQSLVDTSFIYLTLGIGAFFYWPRVYGEAYSKMEQNLKKVYDIAKAFVDLEFECIKREFNLN